MFSFRQISHGTDEKYLYFQLTLLHRLRIYFLAKESIDVGDISRILITRLQKLVPSSNLFKNLFTNIVKPFDIYE